jgi:hypothetical protein
MKVEEYERKKKIYEAQLPTEQDIGWQYAHEKVNGVTRPKQDIFLPAKAATGTILNLDIGNIFGAYKGSSYYRGLAQWIPYEKKPEKVFTSPAAITVYTMPISYGIGRVVGWGFGQAGGLTATKSVFNPIVWTPAKATGLAAVRAAQVPLAGAKVALLGAATAGSASKVIAAGAKTREVVSIPETNKAYTIERGGPFGSIRQAGQEAVIWIWGVRGATKKPMFPLVKQAVYETVYPKYGLKMATRYEAAARARTFPDVKPGDPGRGIQGKIDYLFLHPAKGYKGSLPLVKPTGERLVAHGTSEAIFGVTGKKATLLYPTYVTPGEGVSTPFLRLGGDYSSRGIKSSIYSFLFPKPFSFWGQPRVVVSYAKSSKISRPGTGGYGPAVAGKTAAGYPVTIDKYGHEAPTRLVQALPLKTEIQAIFSGGGKFKAAVPGNLTATQRFFLPFVGGSPYHYHIPGIFGISSRVPVTYAEVVPGYKPTAAKLKPMGYSLRGPSAVSSTKIISSFVSTPVSSSSRVAPSSLTYLPSSLITSRSQSASLSASPSPSMSRSISPSPSPSPSPSKSSSKVTPPSPVILPEPGKKKEEEQIKKYKIPEGLDYYNELKKAFGDIFKAKPIGG